VTSVAAEIEREDPQTGGSRDALEAELGQLRAEEKRLAAAVARVPDSTALIEQIGERVERIRHLEGQLATAKRTPARRRE
jgi:hypothetical protein